MDTCNEISNLFKPVNLLTFPTIMMIAVLCSIFAQPSNGQATVESPKAGGDAIKIGISVMNVRAVVVDHDNTKWFSTDTGVVSFDGMDWKLYHGNEQLPDRDLYGITFVDDPSGPELWVASDLGATIARLPIDDLTAIKTLSPDNAPIASNDVVSIAAGKDSTRWIGTNKGISALHNGRWLTPAYDLHYPDVMFGIYPITSMATNDAGDTLYVGTAGAGVARIYRDQLDGISGASVYAIWGPIILPSDNIQSVYIAPDGTQWFGTTDGIARHTGDKTLENWTVYTVENGLAHNFVQAICGDGQGNIWFGTKGGLTVFDGASWISYTTENGLPSNHILSLAMDRDGILWIGTDVGITAFKDKQFINY